MAALRTIAGSRFTKRRFVGLLALFLTGLLVLSSSGSFQGPSAEVSGIWSDACPCPIPCPCWRTRKSSVSRCINFQAFQVEKGSYNGVDLSGLAFVLLSLPSSPGEAPIPERLFVAESASEKETQAIRSLLERQLGDVSVVRVPLNITSSQDRIDASIAGVLSYHVRAVGKSPLQVEVRDYLYPWLSNVSQWIVAEVTHKSPAGEQIRYSNTNSLHGRFRVPVPE